MEGHIRRRGDNLFDESQEFFAGLGVVSEEAQHGAGDGLALHLLHSTHHHAHVAGG